MSELHRADPRRLDPLSFARNIFAWRAQIAPPLIRHAAAFGPACPGTALSWSLKASFVILTASIRDDDFQGMRGGSPRGRGPGRQEYDEAALLAAAQRGDLPAFNQLILHYQSLAYNIAYRLTSDADLAADATQDAFIKAYQRLNQYRGGSFKSWVLRIVTNTCYDALRARKRRPTTPLESEEDEDDPEYDARLIDGGERPDDRAMRQELAAAIQEAIGQLPPDQRTALVLSDVEGMDYQEIADATGAALGTVKSRLSRARAKVRDLLLQREELLPVSYRLRNS